MLQIDYLPANNKRPILLFILFFNKVHQGTSWTNKELRKTRSNERGAK